MKNMTMTTTARTKTGIEFPVEIEIGVRHLSATISGLPAKLESSGNSVLINAKAVKDLLGAVIPADAKASIQLIENVNDKIKALRQELIKTSPIHISFDVYRNSFFGIFAGDSSIDFYELGLRPFGKYNFSERDIMRALENYVMDNEDNIDARYIRTEKPNFENPVLSRVEFDNVEHLEMHLVVALQDLMAHADKLADKRAEKKEMEAKAKKAAFIKAKETGEPQGIDSYTHTIRGKDIMVNTWAMPDGTTKTNKVELA